MKYNIHQFKNDGSRWHWNVLQVIARNEEQAKDKACKILNTIYAFLMADEVNA